MEIGKRTRHVFGVGMVIMGLGWMETTGYAERKVLTDTLHGNFTILKFHDPKSYDTVICRRVFPNVDGKPQADYLLQFKTWDTGYGSAALETYCDFKNDGSVDLLFRKSMAKSSLNRDAEGWGLTNIILDAGVAPSEGDYFWTRSILVSPSGMGYPNISDTILYGDAADRKFNTPSEQRVTPRRTDPGDDPSNP